MPLLSKEIEIQPEALFELPVAVWPWWVAHVRSRQEKVLARHLAQAGVPFFLPLVETRRRRDARILHSWLPLFAGYVFFRGDRCETVWRSNTIANLIKVPDQEHFGRELEQIRTLQLAGASLRIVEELLSGDPVRITNGPFRGYRGIVVNERRQHRLIVQLSLLKRSVSVELNRDDLRKERVASSVPSMIK